jgi:uncharacterized membrane protein
MRNQPSRCKEKAMLRKILSYNRSVLALALTCVVLLPSVSQAAYLRGQPIYVRNTTDQTISVAAKFMPPGSCDFVVNGFWQIPPGQCRLVFYNTNRWIYLYARDNNGRVWSGNSGVTSTGIVNGESLEMGQYDTTMCFDPWTITFGP